MKRLIAVVAAALFLGGCGMAERAKYQFAGNGVETWEATANEKGIGSQVEEYHYSQLAPQLQEVYREMYVHLMSDEDSGALLSSVGVDDFWNVYYAVLADHPEIFWVGAGVQAEENSLIGKVVSYKIEAAVPVEARPSMREKIEEAADTCIAGISPEAATYEKIKYVYEYLIDTVEYQADSADSQNIQSALLYHSSVCAGYSKAFQYILNRMGIFCTYVTGEIKGGGEHGWNMVRIGEEYYYVDVTWGDPVFANQVGEAVQGDVKNYNYLCCTQYDLFKTHIPDESLELPACTSDAYNYYRRNGCYYETFDWNTIYDAAMQSVWNGDTSLVMKFGSQEAYEIGRAHV